MITIKIPFRNQSTSGMNLWLHSQGLVYRKDWTWDNNGSCYLYEFNDEFHQTATIFSLKFL